MLVATDAAQTLAEPETVLAPDPLQPFTPGGPATDLPVTAADLDRALTLVLAHYPDQDALIRAAKKGARRSRWELTVMRPNRRSSWTRTAWSRFSDQAATTP